MPQFQSFSRRQFFKKSGAGLLGAMSIPGSVHAAHWLSGTQVQQQVDICAHLWVYASKYPPDWDATPALETIFSDLSYAGIQGLELMESILRHDDAVSRLKELIQQYGVPVSGSSYGVGFNMWDKAQHEAIWSDIQIVIPRLAAVGGETFGISVGGKEGLKTEEELDDQAKLLLKIREFCGQHNVEANLHNHTYEVENDLHDLKGTLKRIPDFKLGPDLNWLIRAGVDPVRFIHTYGDQMVYLHIRDQYENGTWTEYVGQGDTDFTPIAAALKAKNFHGKAGIELAFPADFTPEHELKEDWKLSREFVQRTFDW